MSTEYLNNKFFENVIFRFQNSRQEKVRYELMIDDIKGSLVKRQYHQKPNSHEIATYIEFHQKACSDFTTSQHDLATAFYTLSEHLVRYAKDIIEDVDEAVQEGVMICFAKVDLFKPQKGKAFNYLTTCILNHFRQIYRSSKNYKLLKERYRDYLCCKLGHMFVKNGRQIHVSNSFSDD